MKKNPIKIYSAVIFAAAAFSAQALEIKNESEIAGAWEQQATATSLDGPKSSSNKETWIIKDGKLEMKGLVKPRGDTYDAPPMPISIEQGMLRVPVMGRAGKFRDYSLVEKTGDSMVLKGNEGFIFLKKK